MPIDSHLPDQTSFIVLPANKRQGEPFTAHREEDPEPWSQQNERVKDLYRWDDEFRPTAPKRHKKTIGSWDDFRNQLLLVFGNDRLLKKEAGAILLL